MEKKIRPKKRKFVALFCRIPCIKLTYSKKQRGGGKRDFKKEQKREKEGEREVERERARERECMREKVRQDERKRAR